MRKTSVFALLFLSLPVLGLQAAPESKVLVRKYKSTLGQIQESEKKQREILAQLYYINRTIKQETKKRAQLENQKLALQKRVKLVANEYLDLKENLRVEKTKLVGRIRIMATLGAKDFVRVLVNSDSAADIDRSLYLVGKIARKDLDLVTQYRQGLVELSKKKSHLEQKNSEFEQVVKEYDAKLQQLKSQQEQRFALIGKIRKSKREYLTKLKDYRFTAKEMSAKDRSQIVDLILRPSFFEKKGALPLPVKGPLTKIDPINPRDQRVILSSKGMFIPTPENSPVAAIFRAKVEFADFTRGYGGLVILDHGDNYYSVLGNLDQVDVAEGQEVEVGQVVGLAGQRSWRGRRGTYFEIRHFSEPEDPKYWVSHQVSLKMSQLSENENNRMMQ